MLHHSAVRVKTGGVAGVRQIFYRKKGLKPKLISTIASRWGAEL
jgi:hypothetical protein